MRDSSSTGTTADENALLAGSKKLDELKNALESQKENSQLDAMKKVIGYIAKGKYLRYFKNRKIGF
jgi:vesicle coat complex subunit